MNGQGKNDAKRFTGFILVIIMGFIFLVTCVPPHPIP